MPERGTSVRRVVGGLPCGLCGVLNGGLYVLAGFLRFFRRASEDAVHSSSDLVFDVVFLCLDTAAAALL